MSHSLPFTIVIPARLNSSRLPKKMLQLIDDKPLVEWTWREALKAQARETIIATDDQQIFNHMHQLGAKVIMTDPSHPSGTDRLSEIAFKCQFNDEDIIVNWQGDEPFLPAIFIKNVAERLANSDAAMGTLATPIKTWQEFLDTNIVKVVLQHNHKALYFSRSSIPYPRDITIREGEFPQDLSALRHIGLYAYRASFLRQYPNLKASTLETTERLEQLRALSNGYQIIVEISDKIPPLGIDTLEDLEKARLWAKSLSN